MAVCFGRKLWNECTIACTVKQRSTCCPPMGRVGDANRARPAGPRGPLAPYARRCSGAEPGLRHIEGLVAPQRQKALL